MRILILGGDGYLGWPTAMHFSSRGDEVAIIDNFGKRQWEADVGVMPLWPITSMQQRLRAWEKVSGRKISFFAGDIASDNYFFLERVMKEFQPQAIVHYAEQPSAPFSMRSRRRGALTLHNNIIGTYNILCAMKEFQPQAHLVKLGTMGEYGTPNINITEGFIDITLDGRSDRLPFPKKAGSWYHWSKVADSNHLMFASDVWGLATTDLNQGVVYGIETDQTILHSDLGTSFHYDSVFGTVLNRFCVETVCGIPLTVYGTGGQHRGFLNIRDTLKCVEIAVDNPATIGEFRVFNQFTEVFSVQELAELVQRTAQVHGINVDIQHLPNPRVEKEEHYYNPSNASLLRLGLKPQLLSGELVESMLVKIMTAQEHIDSFTIQPNVQWRS